MLPRFYFSLNWTAKTKLPILVFLYCGKFMKNSLADLFSPVSQLEYNEVCPGAVNQFPSVCLAKYSLRQCGVTVLKTVQKAVSALYFLYTIAF